MSMLSPFTLDGAYAPTFPDMQPFSARAGIGYQDLLEDMRKYMVRTLIPYVRDLPSGLQSQLDGTATSITDTVKDALDKTLAEIIAGQNVTLNDATILAALLAPTGTSLAFMDKRYSVLAGAGIDHTGVADSTAAVQAFLDALPDGATVRAPSGSIIRLTTMVVVRHSITFEAGGEWRFTDGMANTAAFNITADNVSFLPGFRMTNSKRAAASLAQSALRAYGIRFVANHGLVTGCIIDGFQQAVMVDAQGEYFDHIVTDNRVLNVPGTSDEDRGDGIYMAGSGFVVTGNTVELLDGTDGRIGIGCESLQAFETANPKYRYSDMLGVMSNNIVKGAFRRSIVNEGVEGVSIIGNTCIGATFWGMAIIGGAHRTVLSNNVIIWTSSQAINPTPICAGIMIYDFVNDATVTDNTIYVEASGTAMMVGIVVNQQAGIGRNMLIKGNKVNAAAHSYSDGVLVQNGAADVTIEDNEFSNFTGHGVSATNVSDLHVCRNKLRGYVAAYGIFATGPGNDVARFDGNTINGCNSGIAALNRNALVTASDNVLYGQGAGVGLDMLGAGSGVSSQASNNLYKGWTTNAQNLPAGCITAGNN